MQFKRARRPLHFYSGLAEYESINGDLTETTIETKTKATQTTQTETANENFSQTSDQTTNSGQSYASQVL